ncbi:hypothetical protein C8A05DRAFT_31083 [Staphylotrichum tortipilum]|uniref:ribonuclease Z n=1 Tax=Staphylotrichum tortipilum TaxID=2831512 RepID=A0AAN6RVK9_9PEZI|nr:hypothetical protein C8A05DRAFT_31083 [Staphylotrichum longicolle]
MHAGRARLAQVSLALQASRRASDYRLQLPVHHPHPLHPVPISRGPPARRAHFPKSKAPSIVLPPDLFPDTTPLPAASPSRPARATGIARYYLIPTPPGPAPTIVTRLPSRGNMLCWVQIVNTPTADTPGGCIVLHFDNRRYLFGRMAEGTQRTMVQRKMPLAKIHDIFLTGSIDWAATGGLLGMVLTIADIKAASAADIERTNAGRKAKNKKLVDGPVTHLNIHGGKNLVHYLATARSFILRKALPLQLREVRHDPRPPATHDAAADDSSDKMPEPDYEDESIKVWSIPLSAARERGQGPVQPEQVHDAAPRSPKKRKLSPSSSAASEPATADADPAVKDAAEQKFRESVVNDMFCSSWNLDTLREMRLDEVQLPAKIFVRNNKGHIEPYTGPPASEAPDTMVLVRLPWPASKVEQLPRTRPSNQAMSYIVKGHDRRGTFDPVAAEKLVADKRDYRKLTSGQSVVGKDGNLVTPDMVIGASFPGRGFAVVDLPSEHHIPALLDRPEFSDPNIMASLDIMFWILSDGVTLDSPGLRDFIKARQSIKHVVLSTSLCPNNLALESPMSQLIYMNALDKQRFPLPAYNTKPLSEIDEDLASFVQPARSGLRYQLAPDPAAFHTDAIVPTLSPRTNFRHMMERAPQALELATVARKALLAPADDADQSRDDLPCPDLEIIPLGTGSAMPSKYRNVSATLIRVPGWGSYLFDCGENTLGQLRRCLGYDGADEVLQDLRAIYISHAHADHHLGTVSVIARWNLVTPDRKLAIIAAPKYHDFLREFHQVQDLSMDRLLPVYLRPVPGGRPIPGSISRPLVPADITCPLPTIEACFVDHCTDATALVLTFPGSGLKLAYSGDCRPSAEFAALGRGAHLLVHECTFEDELGGDARAKKHSTLSEALGVGRRMEARRILLTHFSQRYPKLPVVSEETLRRGREGGREKDVEVLFAFDMMRVKLGEFKQAKAFLPAIRSLLEVGEKEEGGE